MEVNKCAFALILIFSLMCALCLGGCGDETTIDQSPSLPRLSLCLAADSEHFSSFSSNQLGGSFTHGLLYSQVKDVTIEINGNQQKLEEALHSGVITEEEIFFYARQDAANGYCQETSESNHGLTTFFYTYPEFRLCLTRDLLETPDGQQHLITHMTICPPDADYSAGYIVLDPETDIRYDVEDWGLTFTAGDASSTGITIRTCQEEGQQIGQLQILGYSILQNGEFLPFVDENNHESPLLNSPLPITMGGSGEITIDWTEFYGTLPSGS